MAKKKHKKNVKSKQPPPPQYDYTEVYGLFLLAASLLTFLSLLSFAFDNPQTDWFDSYSTNWLGLLGQKLGWFFHSIFGLTSYLLTAYTASLGWNLIFKKTPDYIKPRPFCFLLLVTSLCFLLCLIENRLPSVGNFLQSTFYPSLWERNQHYHLGGALFYYVYYDLSPYSLHRIFNDLGVAIIFTSTFLGAALSLAKISPTDLLETFRQWKANRNEALAFAEPEVLPAKEPLKERGNFLRYVKLRIPQMGTSHTGLTAQNNSSSHELLAIQPDINLKSRPSLSGKESKSLMQPQQPPELYDEKPRKKESQNEPPLALPAPRPSESPAQLKKPLSKEQKKRDAISEQKVHNGDFSEYKVPEVSLLNNTKKIDQSSLKKDLKRQAEVLEETLHSFGIEAKVGQINCGPTINSFEVLPSIGVKVQKIKALENDIALNMEAKSIRIIAPIPGKAAVGIEVPNPQPQEVGFKEMLQTYQQGSHKFHIPVLLGKAVNGDYVMTDLAKMPHCIIAGATGSGKSVCINTIVMSIVLNARPDEIKLIMVDPKKVELTPYTRLPHMLAPVITEPHGACAALHWLVKEMEKRYEILKQTGNRNIDSFNKRKIESEIESALDIDIPEKMHYIVCIVDELADLMMVSSSDIETPIARIAQMARAVGIHMILATQRPSREVITGIIKANFPTRIAFKVASRVNSQIILDETGAESLLGNGDMLFLPPGSSHLTRAQGAFIRDEDINAVIKFICDQAPPDYKIASFDKIGGKIGDDLEFSPTTTAADSLYDQALDIVQGTGNASTTFLQRKLKIGYARAASLIDELESNGIIGMAEGSKARKVLIGKGGKKQNSKALGNDDEGDDGEGRNEEPFDDE